MDSSDDSSSSRKRQRASSTNSNNSSSDNSSNETASSSKRRRSSCTSNNECSSDSVGSNSSPASSNGHSNHEAASDSDSLHTIDDVDENVFSYLDTVVLAPITRAVIKNSLKDVVDVVKSGCELNAPDNHGNTALHHAISKGYVDIVKYLLVQERLRTDVVNYAGYFPIAWAIKNFNDRTIEMIEILIAANCNVNNDDPRISTLVEVVGHSNIPIEKKNEIALILLEANVDINQRNVDKQSALHISLILLANRLENTNGSSPYFNLFHMLLYYNADVLTIDSYFQNPYSTAKKYCPSAADTLFEYIADFNYTEDYQLGDCGYYPILLNSIYYGGNDIFKIIERGADVNAYGHKCSSSDLWSFRHCQVQSTETCLSLTCRINPELFQLMWDKCDKKLLFEVQPDFLEIFLDENTLPPTDFLHYFYKLLEYKQVIDFLNDSYICNLILKQLVKYMHINKLDQNERMKIIFSILCINTNCLNYDLLMDVYELFGFNEELEAFLKVCESIMEEKMMSLSQNFPYVQLVFRPQEPSLHYIAHKLFPRNFKTGPNRTLLQLSRDIVRANLQPRISPSEPTNFKYYLNLLKSNIPNYLIDIIILKKELYPNENRLNFINNFTYL